MFRGKKTRILVCLFASIGAGTHSCFAEHNRQDSRINAYAELNQIFGRELIQKGIAGGASASLATIDKSLRGDPAAATAARLARLCCIYCEVRAEHQEMQPNPFYGDISVNTLEKLGLLAAPNVDSSYSVLHRLALPNETIFGTVARAELFMRLPTYVELQENQQITRYFIEHPDARKKALGALEKIRAAQNDFLWLFLSKEQEHDRLEDLYWSHGGLKKLNKSVAGLFLADAWEQLTRTLPGLTPPCAFIGLTNGLWEGLKGAVQVQPETSTAEKIVHVLGGLAYTPISALRGFGSGIVGEFISHWPGRYAYGVKNNPDGNVTLSNVNSSLFASLGDRRAHVGTVISTQDVFTDFSSACNVAMKPWTASFNMRDPRTKAILKDENGVELRGAEVFEQSLRNRAYIAWPMVALGLAFQDFYNYMSIRTTYRKVEKDLAAYKLAQARLINIARLQTGLKELAAIIKNSRLASLEGVGNEIAALSRLKKTDEKFRQFTNLLNTNTFKGEPSAFSNRARILLAHRLLRKCKKMFLPALHAAGEIETFIAAAEFFVKHQGNTAEKPVCFVEFVDEHAPRLELENCWNILVDEKKSVCIDHIAFGRNGCQHAIFSGPNGTGKSTNENAIAHSIFMGRLGIACASRAIMTPFEICEVHRNEQENIEHGDSSFMAQRARFDEICQQINALADQRMIIFMDEPLNGTVEAEAGRIIVEQCSRLIAHQRQAICLIATHAEQVTTLENITNGIFKNYFVEVIEPKPDQFIRTYRLCSGIPHWWFDDAERRHRFVEWLSAERKRTKHDGKES